MTSLLHDSILPFLCDLGTQSAKASILACVVALLCLLPTRWLSSPWRHVLWCAVFLRLVLPDLPIPGMSWNVDRLLSAPASTSQVAAPVAPQSVQAGADNTLPAIAAPSPVPAVLDAPRGPESVSPASAPMSVAQQKTPAISWSTIVGALWLIGAVAWWIALVAAWWRFRSRVVARSTPASPEMQALLEDCIAATGLRRHVQLRCSGHVPTPVVYGVARPFILIPQALESALSSSDLRLLLLHEIGHVRRRDILMQVSASVLLGLHWWNPILWFSWSRLRHEAEAATDAWVLRHTGPGTAPSYGAMLLGLASRACAVGASLSLVPSLIGATSQGRRLRQRLTAIVSHRPAKRWAALSGFATLLLITMAGFSQEAAKKIQAKDTGTNSAPVTEGSISGIVVDDQDRPVAGAEVAIDVKPTRSKFIKSVLPPGYKAPAPVKTDAEGRWIINGVPEGVVPNAGSHGVDVFFLYVTHPDFLQRSLAASPSGLTADSARVGAANVVPNLGLATGPSRLTAESYRKGTAKVVLNRGFAISGMVRDEAGQPIPGAALQRKFTSSSSLIGEPTVTTDASGRYELRARAGDSTVRVRAPGFATQLYRLNAKGNTVHDFTLKKAQALKLRIRDDKDQPVEGASVAIFPPGDIWKAYECLWSLDQCPADGRVSWDEAPAGPLVAEVTGRNFSRFSVGVTAGEEIEIKLPAANRLTTVTLKVTDADTGAPLPHCAFETGLLFTSSDNTSWMNMEQSTVTFKAGSEPGVYQGTLLESIQRRRVKFCVRREGYIPAVTPTVEPSKGDTTLNVSLQKGKPLDIIVRGDKDAPAPGAKVFVIWNNSLHLKDNSPSSSLADIQAEFIGISGADGRCMIPPCLPDATLLALHQDGFAVVPFADAMRSPSIKLGLYAQVEAIVTRNGQPAPGVRYEFHGGMDILNVGQSILQSFEVVSDAQGRISLPRVLPTRIGRFSQPAPRTSVMEGRMRTYAPSKTMKVSVGQTTVFELEAAESQARNVTGKFALPGGGIPLASRTSGPIAIRLDKPSEYGGSTLSIGIGVADANGNFTFENVAPGTYTLYITPGAKPTARYALAGGKKVIEVTVPPLSEAKGQKTLDLGAIEVVDTEK